MKHLRKFAKLVGLGTWILTLILVVFFNLRLYTEPPLPRGNGELPQSILGQLAANRAALEGGAASRMQEFFPEGYYFSYLFHGLAWVELAMHDASYTEQSIAEAIWCLSHLDSPEGRAAFPAKLPPDHGMFYSAWKCSLRSGIVLLQNGSDPEQAESLRRECDAIVAALKSSETPFLPSYYGSAWPCDTVPAIHALSVYDQIFKENRYGSVIAAWLEDATDRLDPKTGLMPHTCGLADGREASVARATSQVIILRLLPDIDPLLAKAQYGHFREQFLTTFWNIPCVLEYPLGINGPGDVDSGPLVFGRSLSATVLMMGVSQVYGDHELANVIARTGETIGLPWTSDGCKRYMFGALPIGDIMVTYAHVARPWFPGDTHLPNRVHYVGSLWRLPTHLLSLIALLPAAILIVKYRRTKLAESKQK